MSNIKLKAVFVRALIVLLYFISIPEATISAEINTPYYRIGPNDVLSIFVWKEPELTRDLTVMSDGRISFPLIGNIMAQGKTIAELKNVITAELKKYIDAPEITVIVDSSSAHIFTIGNVNASGPYPLLANMTVLQALSTAGGFAEWADTKNIQIVRRQGDKEVLFPFNYKEVISGENMEQNIVLQPNDTIVVP